MIVLATGGTGGHIFAALAVAEEARSRGLAVTVLGERGGMEERLVGAAGVPFVGVSAGKWHRGRPSPAHAVKAAAGVMEAWRFLRRERPLAVIGFGGYASFPGVVAASRLGIPLVLHEGNAYPSKVNRWLARSAALVIAAQPEAFEHLPAARRRLVVPFPVRERRLDREQARRALALPTEQPYVVTLVMGGSQGSATLNREVPLAHALLAEAEKANLHVVHSAGRGNGATVAAATEGLDRYQVHDFLDAATAWAAADLA
ncbi:MAG TPA: glycosyltransferase, partial [Trueperaceae bacterium]|nr:glycosyltransferase [Trueperaceae bacterium]